MYQSRMFSGIQSSFILQKHSSSPMSPSGSFVMAGTPFSLSQVSGLRRISEILDQQIYS